MKRAASARVARNELLSPSLPSFGTAERRGGRHPLGSGIPACAHTRTIRTGIYVYLSNLCILFLGAGIVIRVIIVIIVPIRLTVCVSLSLSRRHDERVPSPPNEAFSRSPSPGNAGVPGAEVRLPSFLTFPPTL